MTPHRFVKMQGWVKRTERIKGWVRKERRRETRETMSGVLICENEISKPLFFCAYRASQKHNHQHVCTDEQVYSYKYTQYIFGVVENWLHFYILYIFPVHRTLSPRLLQLTCAAQSGPFQPAPVGCVHVVLSPNCFWTDFKVSQIFHAERAFRSLKAFSNFQGFNWAAK